MRGLTIIALAIVVTGCVHHGDRLGKVERDVATFEIDLEASERAAAALGLEWDAVTASYHQAAEEFAHASAVLDELAATHDRTSATYAAATRDFEIARANWKTYEEIVVAASLADAAARDARAQGLADDTDCSPTSTAKYRRRLRADGVSLDGVDVDHIVPRSLGGADHPSNYQLIDASLNRSLGNTWNRDKCMMAGRAGCLAAIAISIKCGTFAGGMFGG